MGLVKLRRIVLFTMIVVVHNVAYAEDREEVSRRAFDEGVAHAAAARWEQAAAAFERSVVAVDRPATRFNLVLAYGELSRPLELVRSAIAFLNAPEDPAHAEARARVVQALSDAAQKLSMLTTSALPTSAQFSIDGSAPLADSTRRLYTLPGGHRLELHIPGQPDERCEVTLLPGQTMEWPPPPPVETAPHAATNVGALRSPVSTNQVVPDGQFAPAAPTTVAGPPGLRLRAPAAESAADRYVAPIWSTGARWALGITGALSWMAGFVTYAVELRHANELGAGDPYRSGFLSEAAAYSRLRKSVPPLAILGGALTSIALGTSSGATSRGHVARAWSASIAAVALAVAGISIVVREPPDIGHTRLSEPTREGGVLLLSLAAPLASYSLRWLLSNRGGRARENARGASRKAFPD